MQNDLQDVEQLNGNVLKWLMRTFGSYEEWKAKAREIFFNSNGDSELSRQRLASYVRSYFVDQKLAAEDVEQWSGNTAIKVRIEPPKASASNASYFDWLFVADYLLLCCGSPSEEYEAENLRRENSYQQLLGSFNLRMQVAVARQAIRQSPEMDDQKVLAKVQEKYPKASLANVKEAKRQEAIGGKLRLPIEPIRAANLPLYKSIYF